MLLVALNAIFAGIFLTFAWNASRRARAFLQTGYAVIREETKKPDFRANVESRRAISEAGNFIIGGVFWSVACLVAFGLGVFFSVELVQLYRN